MTRLTCRLLLPLLAGLALFAQDAGHPAATSKEAQKGVPDLPEEDEALKPDKEYSFNPLQAAKEITTGDYYFKKKNYRAAANRYLEATRWSPALAEAFLRLGKAREKQKDAAASQAAYARYLELAPDAKDAGEVRKKLGTKAPAPSSHKP
ncbi:MAG: tetratricopeptide repeat protein [Acidobacteria bacterium]|nr:tetratricopeptide repeat protein [Acidobacteriota bacterium]